MWGTGVGGGGGGAIDSPLSVVSGMGGRRNSGSAVTAWAPENTMSRKIDASCRRPALST
jgi:hypothetical protein